MSLDPQRTPVLVGLGQSIEREAITSAVELATRAAEAAFEDAPGLRDRIDRVSLVGVSFSPASGLAATEICDALGPGRRAAGGDDAGWADAAMAREPGLRRDRCGDAPHDPDRRRGGDALDAQGRSRQRLPARRGPEPGRGRADGRGRRPLDSRHGLEGGDRREPDPTRGRLPGLRERARRAARQRPRRHAREDRRLHVAFERDHRAESRSPGSPVVGHPTRSRRLPHRTGSRRSPIRSA